MTPLHAVLFIGLFVSGKCAAGSRQNASAADSTALPASQQAERRMSIGLDEDGLPDSMPDSSDDSASYSSVIMHHPVATSHLGHQPTSQWTIQDHKQSPYQRNSEVEQQVHAPSRRHRHHSRGTIAYSSNRDEVTEQPESLSTAQTFFRYRGHKGKSSSNKAESITGQDNLRYDDVNLGSQYNQETTVSHLPPGMTHDLMSALLSQQPQTFDYGFKSTRGDEETKTSVRPSRKQQKKYKNQLQTEATEKAKKRLNKNRDSFNVGYSIGFGGPTLSTGTESPVLHDAPNDVVLGKPKSHGGRNSFKLHVNGENSIWKEIHPGVEMSEDTVRKRPLSIAIPEKSHYYQTDSDIGILSGHPGQSVYFLNGAQQDYNNVPTTGQATFDHDHALGQSNTFDFSNAMSNPLQPVSSLSKKDSGSSPKSKPSQYGKQIHQSFHIPLTPQKSLAAFPSQATPYLPFSLDSSKQSDFFSYNNNDFSPSPTIQSLQKVSKNQQAITSTGLAGGYDLSHYMGLGTPVPIQNVYIPNKEGDGQMVPAIVIPISQLNGFDNFGPGLNYMTENKDGFQGFGGDVFNVVPSSPPKEIKKPIKNKHAFPKPHTPRLNDNKQFRPNKGYPGVSSLINLSAPKHLDSLRSQNKHPRSQHHNPHPKASQKIMAPKFSSPNNFPNLKRSPTNRNARLAQLQSELNTILAEEMYRKNRPNRRHLPPPPQIRVH